MGSYNAIMADNNSDNQNQSNVGQSTAPVQPVMPHAQPQTPSQVLPELVNTMKSVNTSTPEAKLNETSMSDNNGGRITFNEDKISTNLSDK